MFEVFDSKETKNQKSHLKNLVSLAKLDGQVTKEEFDFLIKVGTRNGVTSEDIKKMMFRTTTVKVTKPTSDNERFEIIFDLIQMVLADGIMDENELDYAIDLAAKLGFRPAISGVLVRKIALDLKDGFSKEDIRNKVKAFLELKALK